MDSSNNGFRVKSDGLELIAETFGSGPPLVAAHGLSGNRTLARRKLHSLAEHYTITIYDQRGHHESTPITDPALYDPHRMAEDMCAVMDHIGVASAVVLGESMGAATTLLFAMKYPQRVQKLLLTGPAFGDSPNPNQDGLQNMVDEMRQYGLEGYLVRMAQRMREELNAPDEVIETVRFMQSSHQVESLITAIETVKTWHIFEDLSEIASLDMPTCIVAWPEDPLHPLDLAKRMVDILSDATLEVIPSLKHVFINQGALIGETYVKCLTDQD